MNIRFVKIMFLPFGEIYTIVDCSTMQTYNYQTFQDEFQEPFYDVANPKTELFGFVCNVTKSQKAKVIFYAG